MSDLEIINAEDLPLISEIPDDALFLGTNGGEGVNLPGSVIKTLLASIAALNLKADKTLVTSLQESMNTLEYQLDNLPKFYEWLYGDDAPTSGIGVDGQFYLSTINGSIYKKITGVWTFIFQIASSTDVIKTAQAGENLTAGDICFLKSDGKFWKARADALATTKGLLAIARESIGTNASGYFLFRGDYTTSGLTVGTEQFISSATAGLITETAPSTANTFIRCVGHALSATVLHFNPSPDYTA